MASWTSSDSIAAISPALVRALGALSGVAKTKTAKVDTRTGSGYSYAYADLSDVIRSTKEVLASAGLAVLQTVGSNDQHVEISTTILHTSGEWISFDPLRLPVGRTAQETGSAITYGRRYTLLACLGLGAEDDDGASAAPRAPKAASVSRPTSRPSAAARTEAERTIRGLLVESTTVSSETAAKIRARFTSTFGPLSALDPDRHEEALEWTRRALAETGQADPS